jgi:hypothetical protein
VVRAGVVAPAQVHAQLLGRDVAQGITTTGCRWPDKPNPA